MTPQQPGNAAPAFVHVDMDNLWAIAECYGFPAPVEFANFVYDDALPRFLRLLEEAGIRATFFIVGRDLENPANVASLQSALIAGHAVANHSHNHRLDFRVLDAPSLDHEIEQSETAMSSKLGVKPIGFRAPGYGFSKQLLQRLRHRGYRYDSSIMPGPYGFVFRYLDSRLRSKTSEGRHLSKTQYSYLSDVGVGLYPFHPDILDEEREDGKAALLELPCATSPLLRLPFQAGVCMRLGTRYFDVHLSAFLKRPKLPLVFLAHGADLADFRSVGHPFFRSPFFDKPVEEKEALMRYFLRSIVSSRTTTTTEEWLRDR